MAYEKIDARRLKVFPLGERQSFVDIRKEALDPAAGVADAGAVGPQITRLAKRILAAQARGAAVMMAYGAHLVKNGGGGLVRALIEEVSRILPPSVIAAAAAWVAKSCPATLM